MDGEKPRESWPGASDRLEGLVPRRWKVPLGWEGSIRTPCREWTQALLLGVYLLSRWMGAMAYGTSPLLGRLGWGGGEVKKDSVLYRRPGARGPSDIALW